MTWCTMTVISLEKTELPNETRPPITEPYVLFVCVPIEIDEQGRRWTIDQWAKDLALHLDYLRRSDAGQSRDTDENVGRSGFAG